MRLRSRASFVTHSREGTAPAAAGARYTRWIYTLVLVGVIAYLLWYLVDRTLHLVDDGEVVVASVTLASVSGGRLTELSVAEGDAFSAGDPLASVQRAPCQPPPVSSTRQRLQRELAITEAEVLQVRRALRRATATLDGLALQRALELDPRAGAERRDLEMEQVHNRDRLALLETELAARRTELADLNAPAAPSGSCGPEVLTAPFDGHVRSRLRAPSEVVTRGQPILVLVADHAPVRVRFYVHPDDYPDLAPGEPMRVELPDGQNTPAIVDEVVSSARELAETAREDYRALRPDVLVWLRPADSATAALWRDYDRMVVTTRGTR